MLWAYHNDKKIEDKFVETKYSIPLATSYFEIHESSVLTGGGWVSNVETLMETLQTFCKGRCKFFRQDGASTAVLKKKEKEKEKEEEEEEEEERRRRGPRAT